MINGAAQWIDKQIVMLAPVYDSVKIKNRDTDVNVLLAPKMEKMKQHAIFYLEDNFQVIEADGQYGLLDCEQIFPGLEYDNIVKLTYRHYLCQKEDICTLYRYNRIGYEAVYNPQACMKMADFRIDGPLQLKKVLDALARRHPDAYEDIGRYLVKPGNGDYYISQYRHISFFVEWVHFSGAVQRAGIDDALNVKPMGLKYVFNI
jgi:hypothetical protein